MSFYKNYSYGITEDFHLHPCKEADFDEVIDFVNAAILPFSQETDSPFFWSRRSDFLMFIVARALRNPFSLKIMSRVDGRLVALRLCSAAHRDDTLNDRTTFPNGEREGFAGLGMHETGPGEFWIQAEPAIQKCLKVDIIFSLPEYRARVEKNLARFNFSKEKLRDEGYAGILSENSVSAARILKTHDKYRQLAVISKRDYLDNKSAEVPILFKDVRQ